MTNDEAFLKLILKTWSDPDFKAKLYQDPLPILAEYGIETPEGIKVKVVENDSGEMHLVLPSRPEGFNSQTEKEDGVYTIMCSVCHSLESCLTHHS
jgi:hypothetical protein